VFSVDIVGISFCFEFFVLVVFLKSILLHHIVIRCDELCEVCHTITRKRSGELQSLSDVEIVEDFCRMDIFGCFEHAWRN